jgi:hypothetical protein
MRNTFGILLLGIGTAIGAESLPARAESKNPAGASKTAPSLAECQYDDRTPGPIQKQLADTALAIEALSADAQPSPLVDRLQRMLASPCFRDLVTVAPLPRFASALVLRTWWADGGGSWFRSRLVNGFDPRTVTLPPDVRKALVLDGDRRRHALAPILCPLKDSLCGRETKGWLLRLDQALMIGQRFDADQKPAGPGFPCDVVNGNSGSERYHAWRQCVENERPVWHLLPPLGSFQSPSRGWLVVRGRRGHYAFCDELAAYDLESGAAFQTRRCGDLGIGSAPSPGGADVSKTGRGKVTFEQGRMPIENLREAALMIFLWPEMQRDVRRLSIGLKRPEGVEVPAGGDPTALVPRSSAERFTSSDTFLSWAWVETGRVMISGEILFAPDLKRPNGYPSWLLTVAEEGMDRRCPGVAVPADVLSQATLSSHISANDAVQQEEAAIDAELASALLRNVSTKCREIR